MAWEEWDIQAIHGEDGWTKFDAESPFDPSEVDFDDIFDVVVHFKDSDGNEEWFTIHGEWEDYEDLADDIYDYGDAYGEAA